VSLQGGVGRQPHQLCHGRVALLVLELTIKQTCPNLRNTRMFDVIEALLRYGKKTLALNQRVEIQRGLWKNKL